VAFAPAIEALGRPRTVGPEVTVAGAVEAFSMEGGRHRPGAARRGTAAVPAPTAVRLEETFGVRGAREARGVCHRRRAATAPIQVATGASVFLDGVPRARRGAAAALNHNAAGGILILRVGPAGGRHEPPRGSCRAGGGAGADDVGLP
jgi:hypothetical protein